MRTGVLVISLFFLPACGIESDFANTAFRCAEGPCPAGYTCRGEVCEEEEQEPPADAPDGEPVPECGTLDGLQDDFNAESPDLRRWTPFGEGAPEGGETGPRWEQTQGEARFYSGFGREDGGAEGLRRSGYRSVEPRSPTGTLTVEIAGTDVDNSSALFVILRSRESGVTITVSGDTLTIDAPGRDPFLVENREAARWIRVDVPGTTETGTTLTVSTSSESLEGLTQRFAYELPDAWFAGAASVEIGQQADSIDGHEHLTSFGSVGLEPGGPITCPPEGSP